MKYAPCALAGPLLLALLLACSGGSRPVGGDLLLADQDGLFYYSLADGSRRAILRFDDRSFVLDPAISPDGKRIAFIRQPPATQKPDGTLDFGSDLYLVARDGGNPRLLVAHSQLAEFLFSPAWLSDDEIIFEVRGRAAGGQPDLRIDKVTLSSGQRVRFIENGVDPAVSPDGQFIAYARIDPLTQEEQLMLARRDLSQRQTLVKSDSNLAFFSGMVFSPDGSRIAFAALDLNMPAAGPGSKLPAAGSQSAAAPTRHPFAQDVWVINRDGSGLAKASDLAENAPSLAFAGSNHELLVLGPSGFWRIDLRDGREQRLGEGMPAQIQWLR